MFYVIETQYVGPNQLDAKHIDSHVFEVATISARTNSSHEVRTEGWCGTTNDWAVYAHGEFARQESAEDWIKTRLSGDGWREDDLDDLGITDPQSMEDEENGVVARFRPGRYIPMTADATGDWIADGLDDIEADTTDERIDEIIAECQEEVRTAVGCELDEDALREAIESRRQELRDERDEEE